MSAVLAAVFVNHQAAEAVRTRLVTDGFPTDRVELTSNQELGHVKLVPSAGLAEKLMQYFGQLFPEEDQRAPVQSLQEAVLAGRAVIAVHPRGEVETERAVEILNENSPVEMRANDLDKQALEHAAAKDEHSALSWAGRVIVAPQEHGRR
jgi:hypothetical protein